MIHRVAGLLYERMPTNGQRHIYWFTMLTSWIPECTCVLQRVAAEQASKFMFSFMVMLSSCKQHFFHKYYSKANILFIHFNIGERPEAMQTGTSTYIANNIMQTILISIIISTFNIFQNYYTSILFSSRIPDQITWHTRAIIPKLFAQTTSILRQPYELRHVYQRW